MKILIADDEHAIHAIYTDALVENGFEVLHAYDGQETLDITMEHGPKLILLDVAMPHADGHDICARLKAWPGTSHIKIVMISGNSTSDDRQYGLELGADEFLPKPYPIEFLVDSVRKQLGMDSEGEN